MTSPNGPDSLTVETDKSTLKRRSIRGAAAMLGAQGTRLVVQLGSQIVLAHLLDPAVFGLLAMAGPILSLVQIFNELGLTQATVQRPTISHGELSALFWVNVVISFGLALLMAMSAPLVAWFYGEPRLAPITACLAGLLILSGLTSQQIALMNRRMQFGSLAIIDIACLVGGTAVGISTAWFGAGYWSLVLMQVANSFVIFILAWFFSGWRPSRPRWDSGALPLLGFGGHLTGFNFLFYAEANLSSVLIGKLDGDVALGFYDRAFKLVIVPWWQINVPLARVAVALLSRLRDTESLYVRAHQRLLQGLLFAAVPGLVWAAATSSTLVPAVLGQQWARAAPIVAYFSLATTVMPFRSSAYWLFVSQGRVKQQLRYGYVTGVLVIISLLVGAPWGPVGIAASYAAFNVPIQAIEIWGATRQGPVTLGAVLRAAYPVVLAAAVAAVAIRVGQRQLETAQIGVDLRLGASLVLAYAASGVTLLCLPDGLSILRDVWAWRHAFRRASLG